LANLAAGIVVAKVGTVSVHLEELTASIDHDLGARVDSKVQTRSEAQAQCARWRALGERVVFTNGCFDLLHAGHVGLLALARQAGDRLVVGLNADSSVRQLKGPNRPLNTEHDRATVLAALATVDAVVVFAEETPLALIQALKPDVLVKGADYREDQVVGAAEVRTWGGTVVLAPLLPDRSTTKVIERMQR
jgi:D-beta-D-heptose 7-phosphate kinase/D-beta-D-heptose 1-phosphate adenosyltransferase